MGIGANWCVSPEQLRSAFFLPNWGIYPLRAGFCTPAISCDGDTAAHQTALVCFYSEQRTLGHCSPDPVQICQHPEVTQWEAQAVLTPWADSGLSYEAQLGSRCGILHLYVLWTASENKRDISLSHPHTSPWSRADLWAEGQLTCQGMI